MSKIAFSLLVHEEPEVIIDQIVNIQKYAPNSIIVVHINPSFRFSKKIDTFDKLVKELGKFHVIINPERLQVGLENIIQAHISNYYAVEKEEYDYFYFIASNELFIRGGVESFVEKYEYGCENRSNDDWAYIDKMKEDPYFCKIKEKYGIEGYIYSQIEGTFYSKEIMATIASIVSEEYDYKNQIVKYPRDEIYFSTLAISLFDKRNHYVGCCCKIRWEAGVLFTSLQAIKKILDNPNSCYYSVKRVDRKYNDYLRSFIRCNIGNYENMVDQLTGLKTKKYPKFFVYLLNDLYLIKYFIRRRIALLYHKITKTHAD